MSAIQQILLAFGSSGGSVDPTALSIYNKIVGWWELDEASGTTVNDAHTNALHGTSSGLTVNQAGLAANLGTSYAFPAGNNYINIPDANALDITGAVSVMVWCKRNGSQANYPKLFWKSGINDAGGQANYILYHDNAGGGWVAFRVTSGGTNYTVSTTGAMADTTVYQFIGTRNGTSMNIYQNGSLNNSNTSGPSGALDTSSGPIRCGYNGSAGDQWVGTHGQMAVFNGELTADEVAYLYNSGDGISYATLAAAAGH